MHFEILIEDESGRIAVDTVLERILGKNDAPHSWRTHGYKGLGRIPKTLHGKTDPTKRLLLNHLPRLLRGYGKSLDDSAAVIVVVDLDDRDCIAFKQELLEVLNACDPTERLVPYRHRGKRSMALGRSRRREGGLSPREGFGPECLPAGRHMRHVGGSRRCRSRGRGGGAREGGLAGPGRGEMRVGAEDRAAHGTGPEPVAELPGVPRRRAAPGGRLLNAPLGGNDHDGARTSVPPPNARWRGSTRIGHDGAAWRPGRRRRALPRRRATVGAPMRPGAADRKGRT